MHRTLKASYIWRHTKVYHLHENMRVKLAGKNDKEYAEFLLQIGEGKVPTCLDIGQDMIEIDKSMKSKAATLAEFCKSIFTNLKGKIKNGMKTRDIKPDWSKDIIDRAIIAPKNTHVDRVNEILMNEIEGEEFILKSADKVLNEKDEFKFPTEWLNNQNPSGTPPHRLLLKRGAPIMLLRNLK